MTELLSAIAAATAADGHVVELAFDRFPQHGDECAYVVIPHEFHAWGDSAGFPDARQRARTIALCTENPGTPWFEETYELVPQFAAAVSINRSSAAELRRRGIRCEHLQLGYSPHWDTWHRDEGVERDIDMLYLGATDPRRDPLLGGLGTKLWARRCQFLIPPLEPRTRPRPDFLMGTEKYHRLRSAQILLNLHRTTSSALEWMRFLEAICNGCVVVSEPCLDGDPLVPGEHYLAAPVEDMAGAVEQLLDDPDRLRLMRLQTYDFVRTNMPMEPTGERLAELAAELLRQPPAGGELFGETALPAPSLRIRPLSASLLADATAHHDAPPLPVAQTSGTSLTSPPIAYESPRRYRDISRQLLRRPRRGLRVLAQTTDYQSAKPRVSVLLAVPNACECESSVAALASAATSICDRFELLALEAAPSRRKATALRGFLEDHASLPVMFLREPVDSGIVHARNTLLRQARGEYVIYLDAMGEIFPSTLQRLALALDADTEATFAYPMVAVLENDRPVELLGSLPWEPERLASGNWIDGFALIRRARLLELGGYTTDPRLAGWEDFDLWCRCAQAGGHGVHVPQVLAWRRRAASSTSVDGEDGTPAKWKLMRERFPQLLAPSDDG